MIMLRNRMDKQIDKANEFCEARTNLINASNEGLSAIKVSLLRLLQAHIDSGPVP